VSDIRTDDEQLEALKNWWKENGKQILTTVIVVAAGYFGWTFWQNNQSAQIHAANDLFMQLVQAAEQAEIGGVALDEELQTVKFIADQLQNDYANSQYSVLGALLAARTAVVFSDLDDAQARLQWASDNADSDAESQLIGYRLAKVLVARGELDAAQGALTESTPEYQALYADLRGDILREQGDKAGAILAYQEALDALLPGQEHYISTLELKIDNLSVGLGSL
jgi:predicted negative regulator of RcsB-dependent stress response